MFCKLRARKELAEETVKFINNISLILSDICKFILNTFLSLEKTNKIIKIKYLLSCKFSDI